ncbi:flagellar motor protein MotB [Brenneria goodwinii]|uniref:Flagellar motor protein MotB n=1 Tax=Brenneria goodwinii TaxID=1109412 RepID=A0A0G4K266_9GAMM|nr:flagellar motor protein MotB [Brenneria goodwinii]ATA24413.1 flagellar motor protein MotB [Brenneria goodwinii]MCG8158099.1 flagellar motor protein MotB [Brenneria goodwinii]MCG8162440.1 flagellar motor protein MotB [Brenneria goodwinii]MCG8167150.1 flagellar motor protein MotB [Brenneria goodwinii]MCG8171810.1 flagellar motor protein MotB [Brenneria goodwinii]
MKHQHPIIRKKRKSGHAGHHGGSWKIAYADFMTAMMALFLVMWLIAISTPMQLAQIAEYFRTPLKIALTGGSQSSESESLIPGGGDDPTQQQGEVKKNIKIDSPERRLDEIRLNRLRERLDQLIESDPRLRALRPHLLIEMVDEGLRIQIIDSQNRPMFKTGSAQVEPYMRDILRAIAPILNDIPNKLSISGHTDDVPYAMGERGYSNWELSADRANASRRELLIGGLSEGKVLRVVGMASTMSLKQAADGSADINRRISLLVLTQEAQRNIEHENAEKTASDVESAEDLRNMELENPKPASPSADNSNNMDEKGETSPQPVNGVPAPERQQPTTELPAAPDSQATPSQ